MLILNKINLWVKILFYQIIQIIFKRRVLKIYIEIEYQFKLLILILCNKKWKNFTTISIKVLLNKHFII